MMVLNISKRLFFHNCYAQSLPSSLKVKLITSIIVLIVAATVIVAEREA